MKYFLLQDKAQAIMHEGNNMYKRIISLLFVPVMLLLSSPCTHALSIKDTPRSVEEILGEYHTRIARVAYESAGVEVHSETNQQASQIMQETIAQLRQAGYEAYDVNADTFTQVESQLHTDFDAMGLDPNGSYIVVVSSDPEEDNLQNQETLTSSGPDIGPSFQYTFNNTTYTMRYLTITAAYDPEYGTAKYADLLPDPRKRLEDVLNAVLYFTADAISDAWHIGTIASLSGLKLVDFNTSQPVTIVLFAATNYTRIHTQVYTSADVWLSYASVSYATVR